MKIRESRWRILFLFLIFILAFFIVWTRLFFIQALSFTKYQDLAKAQHFESFTYFANRGAILDRDNEQVAISIEESTIYANPYLIVNPHDAAQELASITGIDVNELYERLSAKDKGFVYIARKVPSYISQTIMDLKIEGIYTIPEYKRYYPYQDMASQLIGFVGTDNVGLSGIELTYEKELHGVDVVVEAEKDSLGRPIPGSYVTEKEPIDGSDIYITIDSDIQYFSEQVLKKVVSDYSAKCAAAVVMDPRSGEIIAMASYPTFDLNNFSNVDASLMKNLGTSFTFEPGSIFKSIVISKALDWGYVNAGDVFNLPPTIKVGDKYIKEPHRYQAVDYSVSDILVNSSNVGAALIGMKMGKEKLHEAILDFGFGRQTGIDFIGEESGIVVDPKDWGASMIGALPIGQGVMVTPIQIAVAYSAIANGGYLVKPYIVQKLGYDSEPAQIISSDTSRLMTEILRKVIAEGTGQMAALDRYVAAGKTGTAQKVDSDGHGYDEDRSIVSFVGFAPAQDPKVVIAIVVDEPSSQTGSVWGGTISAPVFKEIAEFTLLHLKVQPDD
ncbi:MAG: penicillin-binding protein 2 [Actinobacteria bacterium]|nr:penicillin-binding protein 2 [Actinomycetota bacterium]